MIKSKKQKDFYQELSRKIDFYEEHYWIDDDRKSRLQAITNKLEWCWKFRKITEEQLHELCDRVTKLWEVRI